MANLEQALCRLLVPIEDRLDRLKYRLRERIGGRNPIMIAPYRGYGTYERLHLKGRVLEDRGIPPALETDRVRDNLRNMYLRFKSNEIPYARVLARFEGAEEIAIADNEGYFDVYIEPTEPPSNSRAWHSIELELLEPIRPGRKPVRTSGMVFVPPAEARFAVISDIDDTVIHTDAAHLLSMARNVLLGNARTRLPLAGMGPFHQALMGSGEGDVTNPMFYVSNGPWNLYDLLTEFFRLNDLPPDPILLLRDWGLSPLGFLPLSQQRQKTAVISEIMARYPDLPFILIGDSGEKDPEIYCEMVHRHPGRVAAVYIRSTKPHPDRISGIRSLGEGVRAEGSDLILAGDALPMARHALEKGWIPESALAAIEAELARDKESA